MSMIFLFENSHACNLHVSYPHILEAACLQYLGNYHENVLGCLEVLQDSDYLYVVMPYCNDGSLYSRVTEKRQSSSTRSNGSTRSAGSSRHHNLSRHTKVERCRRRYVDYQHEELVRGWFLQLLQALSHLQKKGVCHRDLCLENILLLDDHNLVLTDCGLSLRIPYDDESNHGAISDVSQGYQRRLIKSQGQCGRLTYLAPEIIEGDLGFDGFATDLWSAGVILFTCLVGLAPFKWPHPSDCHYSIINQGKLQLLVNEFDIAISDEACDLLQNMFWRNPKKRLVLSEVYAHPWVVGRKERKEYSSFEENSSSPHQSKSVVNPVPTARRPSLLQSVTTTDENSI